MNIFVGLMTLTLAAFTVVGAVICYRRAADPMGYLKRIEKRWGFNYAALVTDQARYCARQKKINQFNGLFLTLVACILIVSGLVIFAQSSAAERAKAQQDSDRIHREISEDILRLHESQNRNRDLWTVTPTPSHPETQP